MKELLLAIEKLINNSNIKNEKEFLDVQEACFYLGISKSTLYKYNLRNVIPYFRPTGSKKAYYLRTDILKYLSENRFMSKREMDDKSSSFFTQKKGENYVR